MPPLTSFKSMGARDADGLTPMQARFTEEYPRDWNGAAAAVRAGAQPKAATVTASRWLAMDKIKTVLAKKRQLLAERCDISAEKVLKELGLIGFANIEDFLKITPEGDPLLDFSSMTRDQAAAIASAEVEDYIEGRGEHSRNVRKVKIKMSDKRAALVDLGKYLGLFVERRMEVGEPKPVEVRFV